MKVPVARFPLRAEKYFGESAHHKHLKALDSHVGNFEGQMRMVDSGLKANVNFSVNWSLNNNFQEEFFQSEKLGQMLVINGWNPDKKTIQVWAFLPDGGFSVTTQKMKQDGTGESVGTMTKADGTVVPVRRVGAPHGEESVRIQGFDAEKLAWELTFHQVD